MPKLKTHKGAARRFKVSARGKIRAHRAGRRHLLTNKSGKRKRQMRTTRQVSAVHERTLRSLLPYA